MKQSCSVVIATRNRTEELAECLKSIHLQTIPPDEIIVVDSSDKRSKLYENCNPTEKIPIKYIHTLDRSSARQRNKGIDVCIGDIIFFFDDDIILDKDFIANSLKVYEDDKSGVIGCVQGVDLNVTKSFLSGKRRLLFYRLFMLDRNDSLARLLPSGMTVHLDYASPEIRHSSKIIRVYCAPGGITSYRREALEEFRFDENYNGYSHGEDVELSHRVSQKYEMYFTPEAKLFHNQPPSKIAWYRTEAYIRSAISAQVYIFRKLFKKNPLNYIAILWSWFGLLIWNGIVHPNKKYFVYYLRSMKKEFWNIFRKIA
ncbi:MAG: glycosyltransferase [Proteobacteria bacterium]|nr:glycosyltransferase [Pseudomonadota bacterium]